MKNLYRSAALAGAAAILLGACGSAPEESGSASGSDSGASSDYKACMVSDSGGFDDKSFNQSGYEGLQQAKTDLGIETATAESNADSDFAPNLSNLVGQNCKLIISVGFNLASATADSAQQNSGVDYAIIDSTPQDADGNTVTLDNVRPIEFETQQAAYLAGYVAAGMSETGKVATYGGGNIPSVTIFMDGFADGVAKYNEDNGKNVELLGWNKDSQDGSFTGDFEDQTKGKQLTEGFISQGADIIMPVAGPVGAGTLASAKAHDGVKVVWVDNDGAVANEDYSDIILTSVTKGIATSVEDVVTSASKGDYTADPYIGTLENEGVGLAPYHDFDSQVPDELKQQVDQLKQDIIDGKITVDSPASPSATE